MEQKSVLYYGTKKCSIVMYGTIVFYSHAWNKKVFHTTVWTMDRKSVPLVLNIDHKLINWEDV
jgi:hypothetical protein